MFLTYDENDGFFDHVVPPTPPQSRSEGISTVPTTNEIFTGSPQYPTSSYPAGPYGLGVRVPMIVISPWSKGGYVNSEVFDHTSLIRFIEKRFGAKNPELIEPNITQWRRAVTGDLSSTFNFANPNDSVVPLPSTKAYIPPDNNRHPDYVPTPPADQALPVQEPGIRPARALPYELYVTGQASLSENSLRLFFANAGKAGAVFQVRSGNTGNPPGGPWTYTVSPGTDISDLWQYQPNQKYDLSVYGPNGFFRTYRGHTSGSGMANLDVAATYNARDLSITLDIQNLGLHEVTVSVKDGYTGEKSSHVLGVSKSFQKTWSLVEFFGWYDLLVTADGYLYFERHLAGHIENGEDSTTDPAIAAS